MIVIVIMSAITNLAQQLKTAGYQLTRPRLAVIEVLDLVCTNFDTVIEFEQCNVEALARELAEKYNFQIRGHLLEFQGLCKTCRQ